MKTETSNATSKRTCVFHFAIFSFSHSFAEFQRRQFLERMGEAFLLAVLDEYCGALQSLGSDLFGFLQNLGSVYQEMKTAGGKDQVSSTSSVIPNRYDISFSCVPEQGRLTLHFRTAVAACGYLWAGILKVGKQSSFLPRSSMSSVSLDIINHYWTG